MGCSAALAASLVVAVMVAYVLKSNDFGFAGVFDLSNILSLSEMNQSNSSNWTYRCFARNILNILATVAMAMTVPTTAQ